jgi:phage terminase small subunit
MENTNEFEKENSLNQGGEETFQSPAELERALDEAEAKAKEAEEEETPDVEETTEKTPDEESAESLRAQRDRLYARLKKAEREKAKANSPKPVSDVSKGGEDEWKSKVEFLLENRDVNDEEYEHLATVALRRSGSVNAESLRNAKKEEAEYIAYKRKKEELKRKVPGSTSASPFEKAVKSDEEIAKMTPEQHMKYERELLKLEENQGI